MRPVSFMWKELIWLVAASVSSACLGQILKATEVQNPRIWRDRLILEQPTISPNPNVRAPLVALVELETSVDCVASLKISDGARQWSQEMAGAGRIHRVAVLGMRPKRTHEIVVSVSSLDGMARQESAPLNFTTPSLPDDFPPLRTLLAKEAEMEPGITMFAVNLWQNNVSLLDYGYLIALDSAGEVVWFCRTQDRISDSRVLKNGHLLYQHGSYRYLYEMDLLGRDHRSWYAARTTARPNDWAIAVDVDTMHHEIRELPNGNFLTLATELRQFEQYPTSETDPDAAWTPAWVVCDEVVEFEPDTGRVIQRFPLTDLLDTRRFGYLSLGGFWRDKYDTFLDSPSRDWSHANGLQFLTEDYSIIVSLRHLDCVIKIGWKDKRLHWILGTHQNWSERFQPYLLRASGPLEWFYHQHAPHITATGSLLMYDNGNYRAVPFDTPLLAPDNSSRVVAFAIDYEAMTVRQVYSFGARQNADFYCPFFGEAELLPLTGNLLITDGGHVETAVGVPFDEVPGQRQWARIFEITGGKSPRRVFEVICQSPLGSELGWSVYRSNRFPGLTDPFHIDLNSNTPLSQVYERKAVEKVDPLSKYSPQVVPAAQTTLGGSRIFPATSDPVR